jgi:predicted methyltransferase
MNAIDMKSLNDALEEELQCRICLTKALLLFVMNNLYQMYHITAKHQPSVAKSC